MLRYVFIILQCLNIDCFGSDTDFLKLDHGKIYAEFCEQNCFRRSNDGNFLFRNDGNFLFREDHPLFTQLVTFEEGLPQEFRDRLDLKGKTVDNIRDSYLTAARTVSDVLASPNACEGIIQILSGTAEKLLAQKEGPPKEAPDPDLKFVMNVRNVIATQDFDGFVFSIQRIGFSAVPVWGKETAIYIFKMGLNLFICNSYQSALTDRVEFKDVCGKFEHDLYQWVMEILNSSEVALIKEGQTEVDS